MIMWVPNPTYLQTYNLISLEELNISVLIYAFKVVSIELDKLTINILIPFLFNF